MLGERTGAVQRRGLVNCDKALVFYLETVKKSCN